MDKSLKSGGGNVSGLASIVLPGRKLATSKSPRMLKPSEIALLQQDLKAALSVIGRDEVEDAHALLTSCGFSVDDFAVAQQSDTTPSYPAPVTGAVTWSRMSNQVKRTYVAGHGSSWLLQFEADLRAGLFGRPDESSQRLR
jgi:hypothetical protein